LWSERSVAMDNKEYWDNLDKKINDMSDEEFIALLDELEKQPDVFAIGGSDGED
jgi:23S rRNA pseudoU1915 N3-methylase RlmH